MKKPNLLLLHGALGTKEQLKPIKELLLARFEVYDLNFSGHGGNDSNEPFSIDLFTQNVIDFLSANNLKRTSIFGYSMGGYVALNLAIKRPDLADKIVTYGTKFDWTEESSAREVKMLNPDKIEEKVPRFAEKLKQDHAPEDWKVVMSKTADMMLRLGDGESIDDALFGSVQHTVTIGIGERDEMVTLDESEKISKRLPKGKLIQLPELTHPIDRIEPSCLTNYIVKYIID